MLNKYEQSIENLLNRYSTNEQTVFELVKDLKEYDHCCGIYVLCFDEEQKVYIGQATKSIYKRVNQHFTNPQTTFDKTHKKEDISKIYALQTTYEFIDYIECDCVSMFTYHTCCNGLIPGTITALKLVENAKEYRMSNEFVQMIVEEDVPKAKKWNEDEKAYYQWQIDAKKADKDIKKLKDDKKSFELCKLAFMYNSENFAYIPEHFKTQEFCLWAIEFCGCGGLIEFVPENLLTEDFAIKLVKINRRHTAVLPKHLKTEAVMTAAGYRKKKK